MILPLGPENPLRRKPYVTLGLLAMNLLVYIVHLLFAVSWFGWIVKFGLIPARIFETSPTSTAGIATYLTLLTCAFVHGGLFHLLGNAFFLYAYGCKLEERLGHIRFLLFYILVQLSMASVYIFLSPRPDIPMVGASGAISGILGAYLLKFPHTRIRAVVWVFIRVWFLRIPAYVLLGFWLLVNILYASIKTLAMTSNVAWIAHLLGFGFGILWIGIFAGFRVESSAQEEKTHNRKEIIRSVGSLLRGEARYLVLLIILPLLMYLMALGATYFMDQPRLYSQAYTMRLRSRYALYILLNNYPIFLGLIGLAIGFFVLRKRQQRIQQILETEACIICRAEDTYEDEEGYTSCRACGFHTRMEFDLLPEDPRIGLIRLLKQLRMCETFLHEAEKQIAQEIAQSSLVSFSEENIKDSLDNYEDAMRIFRELLQQHDASLKELLPSKREENDDSFSPEASKLPERFAAEDLPMLMQVTPTYITTDGSHKSLVELKRQQNHILQLTLSFLRQVAKRLRQRITETG